MFEEQVYPLPSVSHAVVLNEITSQVKKNYIVTVSITANNLLISVGL
jgi:hypothetical protein